MHPTFHGNEPGLTRRDFILATTALTVGLPAWLAAEGDQAKALAAGPASLSPAGTYFETAFGVSDADCEKLLRTALSGGGDYADLYFQHGVGTWIVMEDGKVNRGYTSVSLGVGVRVIKGEQTGYAFSQALDLPAMLEAAKAAASLASAGRQDSQARGLDATPLVYRPSPDLYPMVRPWEGVDMESRMALLRRVGGRMTSADPAIVKTLLQLSDATSRVMVVNSEGAKRADLRPRTGLYASCVAEKNGERESGHRDVTARAGLELYDEATLDGLADETVTSTLRLFEARPLAAGEMPCVLAPGSSGILLHEAIGHGLEADFNRREISTYSGRLGQTVAGEAVTVVDDGTVPGSHGAINFDDEGADTRRTVLVEKGVLTSYLQDRLSASYFKTASTGSGRRQSYQHPPMPRMRATYMEPGQYKPEEVIAAVKKGLYAEQFTNGQVNIGGGDFSFYVKSGWVIENGKLSHPVKDINVTGNGPQVLGRITMVADDPALARAGFMCGKMGQTVPVSQGLPTTLVSAINVGGTHG